VLLRLPAARGNQAAQQLLQLIEQCCIVAAAGTTPELHHDIQCAKFGRQPAVHDARQALDPVTIDSPGGNFFADDQPETRTAFGIGQGSDKKTAAT